MAVAGFAQSDFDTPSSLRSRSADRSAPASLGRAAARLYLGREPHEFVWAYAVLFLLKFFSGHCWFPLGL
jgi:hypothetical protein